MPEKDIRLEIKIRNNLILRKMEEKGIETVVELWRQMKAASLSVPRGDIDGLINMTKSARLGNRNQNAWSKAALSLSDFFNCMPEELFSEPQQHRKITKNRITAELAYTDLQRLDTEATALLPDAAYDHNALPKVIARVLATLTPREERVLRLRFGIGDDNDLTLEEIGEQFNVTRERIRNIEAKALRKLKHPIRSKQLRGFLEALG